MLKKTWIFSLDNLISNPNSRKLLKLLIGIAFFVLTFSISYTLFFKDSPLFGVKFLAELLLALIAFMLGFMLIPRWMLVVKNWVEQTITKIITDIVSAFWTQQSAKITEERRKKVVSKNELAKAKKLQDAESKLAEQLSAALLLDTSVLIDGRIISLAKIGFLVDALIVIPNVINELHAMADSADDQKRQKGRRGLDNISKLKKVAKVVVPDLKSTEINVDSALIDTAKKYSSKIMTLDFNLNKVAKVSGISVLNINELVEAIKKVVVPGEILFVKVLSIGKEKDQGVGYLEDGTMVVVEGGATFVGQEVNVKVTKVIQTQAGKMIFCKPI